MIRSVETNLTANKYIFEKEKNYLNLHHRELDEMLFSNYFMGAWKNCAIIYHRLKKVSVSGKESFALNFDQNYHWHLMQKGGIHCRGTWSYRWPFSFGWLTCCVGWGYFLIWMAYLLMKVRITRKFRF